MARLLTTELGFFAGGKYVVEVGLKKKIAVVQIDAANEEIREYEIKDIAPTPSQSSEKKSVCL